MNKKIMALFLIFSLLMFPNISSIAKSMASESIDNSYVEFSEEKFTFPLIVVEEDRGDYKFRNIEDECRKKGLNFIVLTEKKDKSFQCDVYIFMEDKHGSGFKEYKVTLLPEILNENNILNLFDKKYKKSSVCTGIYQSDENEILGFLNAQRKLVMQRVQEEIPKNCEYYAIHEKTIETIQKKKKEDPDFNVIFDYIEYKEFLKICLILQKNSKKLTQDYLRKYDTYCNEFVKFADKISNLNINDVKEGLKNYYYNNHFVFFTLKGIIESRIVNKEETKLFCENWDKLFLSDLEINSLEEKDEYIKNLNEIMDNLNFIKEDKFLVVIAKQINKGIRNLIQELKLSQEVIVKRENPELSLKNNRLLLEFDGKTLPIIYKKRIGKGTFGEVHCCWDIINRREIVIKQLNGRSDVKSVKDIPDSLLNIDCPYFAKILGVIPNTKITGMIPSEEDKQDLLGNRASMSIIMEYIRSSHNLTTVEESGINPYPFYDIQKIKWAIQLTEGLKFISDRGFLHRDLLQHGGNVLIDKSRIVKIIDYEDVVQVGKDEAYEKNFYNAFCNISILFSPAFSEYPNSCKPTFVGDSCKDEDESGERLVKKLFQKLDCEPYRDMSYCPYKFKFHHNFFFFSNLTRLIIGDMGCLFSDCDRTVKLNFKNSSKKNLDYLLKSLRELEEEYRKTDRYQREMSRFERFCSFFKS